MVNVEASFSGQLSLPPPPSCPQHGFATHREHQRSGSVHDDGPALCFGVRAPVLRLLKLPPAPPAPPHLRRTSGLEPLLQPCSSRPALPHSRPTPPPRRPWAHVLHGPARTRVPSPCGSDEQVGNLLVFGEAVFCLLGEDQSSVDGHFEDPASGLNEFDLNFRVNRSQFGGQTGRLGGIVSESAEFDGHVHGEHRSTSQRPSGQLRWVLTLVTHCIPMKWNRERSHPVSTG